MDDQKDEERGRRSVGEVKAMRKEEEGERKMRKRI